MVRVSQHYKLSRGQGSLEFVDVNIDTDTPLFVDAGAIRFVDTPLATECASLIQSFFTHVLDSIRDGRDDVAIGLLATLGEPNETRLGLSTGRPSGHGMGGGLAETLWDRLRSSRAVSTGVLQDLEETALFVRGIDKDIISDIVTNIIREPLIGFTQVMCSKYKMPMESGIAMHIWNKSDVTWSPVSVELPVASGEPLLLVPRNFVRRRRGVFAADQYYRHFVVPFIQNEQFDAANGLRRILADGTATLATKKTIMGIHPRVKETNVDQTESHPELLERYRESAQSSFEVIGHDELADATQSDVPDFDELLTAVLAVPPGDDGATSYHRAVEVLLTALFYPALDQPVIERHLHEGRKRVDIQYTNIASRGFFHWLHAVHHTPCSFVTVECKNYSRRIANPEYDQLAGRFSTQRGRVGILCYRGFVDKSNVVRHCRDAALDGRGYIIPLDDEDLRMLVAERKSLLSGEDFASLHARFNDLV